METTTETLFMNETREHGYQPDRPGLLARIQQDPRLRYNPVARARIEIEPGELCPLVNLEGLAVQEVEEPGEHGHQFKPVTHVSIGLAESCTIGGRPGYFDPACTVPLIEPGNVEEIRAVLAFLEGRTPEPERYQFVAFDFETR